MRRGNHIDAGRQLEFLKNLRRAKARFFEAVIETERADVSDLALIGL